MHCEICGADNFGKIHNYVHIGFECKDCFEMLIHIALDMESPEDRLIPRIQHHLSSLQKAYKERYGEDMLIEEISLD